MSDKHATVKAQVPGSVTTPATNGAASAPHRATGKTAEEIRVELAEAWGDMGAAWGVTPAIARVQAYLMARQEPLTEREVREALGLSHRAASLALAEAELWGIVERVPEPRRVGRRGPAGTAYLAVGDHWQWFGRVIAERKVREGDPIVAVLEAKEREAADALATNPDDAELVALRDWLSAFLVFVRLFDRAVGLVPQLEPRELERSLQLLGRIPDATILRPVRPARRPRRRRRHRPDRDAVQAVPEGGTAGNQVDVRRRQDRRPLAGHPKAAARRSGKWRVDAPLPATRRLTRRAMSDMLR